MELNFYIYSLAIIPVFTSSAFWPLFATVFIRATIKYEWAWQLYHGFAFLMPDTFERLMAVDLIENLPAFLVTPESFCILGAFAILEGVAKYNPETRRLIPYADETLKGMAGFLICFFLIDGSTGELLELRGIQFHWGQSLAYTWSFFIGGAIWFSTNLRNAIYGFLEDIDDDDDLGIQRFLSLMEDAIGFFGVLFVVILPPIALAVSLLTLLALYLVKRHIEVSEEKQKTPCPQCETLIYPCGTTCYSCGYSLTEIRKVGLFGVIRNDVLVPISDELAHNRVHRFPMLSWKRCYSCGERLTGRTIDQHCMVCESKPFSSMAEVDEFLRFLNPRLWRAMLICGVLGFIPLFGLIPGLIYYRLTLISCLRGYIPRSSNFLLRWGVRLLNILLLAFQPVPILGACMLPIMCSTNYFVYREAIRRQSRKAFA